MGARGKDLVELLTSSSKGRGGDEGGLSMNEITSQTGMTRNTVRAKLLSLKNSGLLVCIRVTREALDGRPASIPTYKIKSQKGRS